MSLAYKTRIK
jgi:hypothetical protein